MEKIALGLIIPSVERLSPIVDFLENARKYKHEITNLIIGYSDFVDQKIIAHLRKYCHVTTVKRGDATFLEEKLCKLGLAQVEIDILLRKPEFEKYHKMGYGTSRNHVLITAILLKMDFLLFFDSDIFPYILHSDETNTGFTSEEIDFVGAHLKYLHSDKDVVVTSSDYTGYYIIPKMNFPYLRDLLFGVQKEDRFSYISAVSGPVTCDHKLQNVFDTEKILGGNLAINLNKLSMLPPFFSNTLVLDNECYLGRGEDTLFSPIIHYYGGKCLDIDLLIFHNCFGDFPVKPDIAIPKNKDRFFYATIGWIIRNPFYNWLRSEYFKEQKPINYAERYEALVRGSQAAAEFLLDERFLKLPRAFEKAYKKLPEDIEQFHDLLQVWKKMIRLFEDQKEA